MSKRERMGERSLIYSQWHRQEHIASLLQSDRKAWLLAMIDLDDIEYCPFCHEVLALIETTLATGREKSTTITKSLAASANKPAYLVYYKPTEAGNIEQFQIQQCWPIQTELKEITPEQYASFLFSLRVKHAEGCIKCKHFLESIITHEG